MTETIDADWLSGEDARAVTTALEGAGHQALFVGGCVRNALLGVPVTDLDLSTDARPERVIALAEAAGLKAVPTGIDHGTVTVVHRHHPVEVTTFRADIETHGRHATVRFSGDVAEDAARRDFTMNALYCDPRGRIVDPLGGLPDLRARRLRFVGDATARVHEDYLRILRFFRFHAWYADPEGGFDPEGLAACAEGADGLARISAERIGGEIKKLLAAPDPSRALAAMERTGILHRVLPGADAMAVARLTALEPAQSRAPGSTPDAIARLAALGGEEVADRLRLSKAEARRVERLRAAATGEARAAELGWRLGAEDAHAALAIRAALSAQGLPAGMAAAVARGAAAEFPVKPADLMPAYEGAALGARLKQLEAAWIESGLTLGKDALLARPDDG
ncbi:CCA tRNA nucleotidyltransferase [Rhodovulum sp. 12E13]|uniref:CCA tRNA nucleotidyltransferase n=1 Tax=Rhodovulum sp. 12E13 TaxID=2203891 RepID=UPI000E159EE6|nr:CCA tRNA nucleotidyltransferase [Rhodovulum sp. 12E13]RDC73767.1 CCA tRNA nucleotidyltransferase [Rhodovulum sp. 12E13]